MARTGKRRRRRHARRILATLTSAIAGTAIVGGGLVGAPPAAHAAGKNCPTSTGHACVILVEVSGLEPKDVTRQNTPFLWALAHSGDGQNDPEYGAYPALSARNGWGWQAARSVMSTGDGPATASLLTGDTAEQSGIPADLFAAPPPGSAPGAPLKYYAVGGGATGPGDSRCGDASDPCDPTQDLFAGSTVLFDAQSSGKEVGVWLGDPAVCSIVNAQLDASNGLLYDKTPGTSNGTLKDISAPPGGGGPQGDCPSLWGPIASSNPNCGASSSQCYQGESQYCPPSVDWPSVNGTQYYPAACPATDGEVLAQATQDITSGSGYPDMSFLELADVGLAKQRAGDSDCFAALNCGTPGSGGSSSPTEPPAVGRALESTDAALAAFASALAQQAGESWRHTYLMVVGSHGYETTPTALRVPDPTAVGATPPSASAPCTASIGVNQTGTGDLSCYVAERAGSTNGQPNAVLVPQGTMATIYYTGPQDPQEEESTLNKLYTGLCGSAQAGSSNCSASSDMNSACQQLFAQGQASGQVPAQAPAQPRCIQNVYYVDPSAIPSSDAGNYSLSQFLFGKPGDPGYPTTSNPSYDPNPDCQSTDPSASLYDASGNCDPNLRSFYQQQHASWHLNALDSAGSSPAVFHPTGASGQMVVVLNPGWAAGPLAGVASTTGPNNVTLPAAPVGTPSDPVDPYLASSGGPRDRAVAAIINGADNSGEPVVQYPDGGLAGASDGLAPVTSYDPTQVHPGQSPPYVCDPHFLSKYAKYQDSPSSASFAVDLANSVDPGNDSAAFGSPVFNSQADSSVPNGFECQAQTIDFAPTIQSLEEMSGPSGAGQQADARFLDEAFAKCLEPDHASDPSGPICGASQNTGAVIPTPNIVVTPIIQQPQQVIIIPPKKPKPYGFHGLIRNVQAQVVDQSNNTVPFALPGAFLSSIRVTADFGKPTSEVTITLYKNSPVQARSAAGRPRTRLTATVRFCPFTVKRDPNVQLRFEVPPAYQPDHVGLAVRQVRTLSRPTGPGCGQAKHNAFVAYGPVQGAIVPILDAQLLHKLKPCPAALVVGLPHGPGVSGVVVTIFSRRGVARTIQGSQLSGTELVLPAVQLPDGPVGVRVQWLKQGRRRQLTLSYARLFYNCTLAQRRRLGVR